MDSTNTSDLLEDVDVLFINYDEVFDVTTWHDAVEKIRGKYMVAYIVMCHTT